MNYKRRTSKYYIHKEIELIMFKLNHIKQLYFIYKKIKFKDGYENIYKELPRLTNIILRSIFDRIILELSGLIVDFNDEDLSICSFISKFHEYESDYKEKKYVYVKEIDTGKKHRLYIDTNSIKDDINELETYINNNKHIRQYIKKLRDKTIAHNDKTMSFNKNYKYEELKAKITYEELEKYIDTLYSCMNTIYSTLFKIQFAYYDELDSELNYLDSILKIKKSDMRKLIIDNEVHNNKC